jgi:hypothetical protein
MIVNAPKVSEIAEMIIAIVRFGPPTDGDGLRAGEYFQVCINPHEFSPCGTFVRFGRQGDELVGWQRADRLYVVAELCKVPTGSPLNSLQLPWGKSPALSPPEEVLQ